MPVPEFFTMSRRNKKKLKPTRLASAVCYVALCGLAVTAGAAAGWMHESPLITRAVTTALNPPKAGDAQVFEGKRSVNLLLLGCDVDLSPGGRRVLQKQARSDMMLVAHLDFDDARITGLSIQRDTLCAIPGYREQKINSYHAIGVRKSAVDGKELARLAVQTILPQVEIDRVLVLNYDAFQEMVELVGGVSLFVDKKMDYDDRVGNLHIHFKPGKQHLDGYESMAFVRFRHSDDDWHRTERQKQFLMAFKDSVMKNLGALNQVAEKGKQAIGGGLSDDEIIMLSNFASKISQDNIKIGGVPVVPAGQYTYHVDQEKLPSVLAEYHFIDPPPLAQSELR
jgi:polyisoprenyl-teichoic acid--peptidoglycan teichoic acid transferase